MLDQISNQICHKDLGVIIFEFVAKTQFLCSWTDWIPLPRTSMLLDLGVE